MMQSEKHEIGFTNLMGMVLDKFPQTMLSWKQPPLKALFL